MAANRRSKAVHPRWAESTLRNATSKYRAKRGQGKSSFGNGRTMSESGHSRRIGDICDRSAILQVLPKSCNATNCSDAASDRGFGDDLESFHRKGHQSVAWLPGRR